MSTRRGFLTGAAAIPALAGTTPAFGSGWQMEQALELPAPTLVTAHIASERIPLVRAGLRWTARDIEVTTEVGAAAQPVFVSSPNTHIERISLRWPRTWSGQNTRVLGDAWERSYGDLEWRGLVPERVLPWYVLVTDGSTTHGFGVKTGAASMCFWQVDADGITLWLDVRNGGQGVQLGKRRLLAATIVTHQGSKGQTPFAEACDFCSQLVTSAIFPKEPVIGGNNWYYAYGENCSAELTLRDCDIIAELSPHAKVRPWMVIDDGWSIHRTAGPWEHGNSKFPDMPRLAENMGKRGARPGIWMRPLITGDKVPANWLIAGRDALDGQKLDPTVPEVATKVTADVSRMSAWGFELIKHDFSSFDLLGGWGFGWNAEITGPSTRFFDPSRTNAEIIRDLYELIRKAAGSSEIIACNTVGHLTAGLAEMHRIGDDTSGKDWNRTRKMGVNTLAFRLPQNGRFFGADPDCVGLTTGVPWNLNRQWLDLVARSGMPLFVSIDPPALGVEQKKAIREAFDRAIEIQSLTLNQRVAEPSDWLDNTVPGQWHFGTESVNFDWFAAEGASPFHV